MSIKEKINLIQQRIGKAAINAERNPGDIKILGVSKKVKSEAIIEAYNAGLLDFGENYAQDFRDKYSLLNQELINAKWHFIGHLQKNKIKYVIGKAEMIHSVNSLSLAEEINIRSESLGIKTNILIEINSGGEETKTGIAFSDAEKLINEITELKNISFKGLMTMAPYFDNPELARPYFKELKLFSNEIIKNHPRSNEISMGMSGDFEVAVEEGSTIVRIGSAIFGERNS
ncbi:MAG: YggS family pyridoxal phosphate-dependent enzyme [Thermodesulfobacteriota bacterium]